MIKNLNPKELYRLFFYLFLLAIPLQTRKVFLTNYSFYSGAFTEYGTLFLYLSDILFMLALASLMLFNQDQIKNGLLELKKQNGKSAKTKILYAISSLIIWFLTSALLHPEHLELSLYGFLKMAEIGLLVFFVLFTLNNQRFLISSLLILTLTSFFQSIVAIYQFICQHSLFSSPLLHKLTGETLLSPELPGIATIWVDNDEMIRSYGTFPHPNLLGGFILFSFFISLYLYLEHKDIIMSSKCFNKHIHQHKIRTWSISLFWLILFTSQLFALLFSFSRSAWIGTIISILFFCLFYPKKRFCVSRETIMHKLPLRSGEIIISLALVIFFISCNSKIITGRILQNIAPIQAEQKKEITLPNNDTFGDRAFFNNVSRETLKTHPIAGSGPNTFIFQIAPYLKKQKDTRPIEHWQYQPSHNIYMLSLSEIGVVGFTIFAIIIVLSIQQSLRLVVSRETTRRKVTLQSCLASILIGLLFIGLFDHYPWTLQQGALIFWITLGLLFL